jgi:hypothetical protein
MLLWLLDGSGQAGTPCERMQWEKATSLECADAPALGGPPEPADDPLPLQAVSRATAAAMMRQRPCPPWPAHDAVAVVHHALRGLGGGCAPPPPRTGTNWYRVHGLLCPGWSAAPRSSLV